MNQLTKSVIYSLFIDNLDKNWVFSPASYLEAMGSLSACIKNSNLSELLAVAPDISEIQSAGLDTYNCLLYSAEYRTTLNEAVLEVLETRGSELKSFSGPEIVGMVNAIVREKTHGKIDNIMSPDDYNEYLKFVILNCVYFKKEWAYPFEEERRAESFKGATKISQVKFLHNKIEGRRYYEGQGYDIVELTYQDTNICCYLFVPTTSNVFELAHDLDQHLAHIADVKSNLDVDLVVPAFKIESTFDLIPPTDRAGVKNIFTKNQDWSLIDLEKLAPGSWMKVAFICQKAYIDFTKKGTEAAAVTVIGMTLGSGYLPWSEPPPVKYIRADKPFVYVLANRGDPSPLFIGTVNDV